MTPAPSFSAAPFVNSDDTMFSELGREEGQCGPDPLVTHIRHRHHADHGREPGAHDGHGQEGGGGDVMMMSTLSSLLFSLPGQHREAGLV